MAWSPRWASEEEMGNSRWIKVKLLVFYTLHKFVNLYKIYKNEMTAYTQLLYWRPKF